MSHWKGYDDRSVTEKAMILTGHWKGYDVDGSSKRLWWWISHWKDYDDEWELKRLWWWVSHWKDYDDESVTQKAMITGQYWRGYDGWGTMAPWGRRIWNTLSAHTMTSQQPDPWTPRWVREKLGDYSNGILPSCPSLCFVMKKSSRER
jgi:hypothetical protein